MRYIDSMRRRETQIISITDDFMFKAVFSDRNLLYDLLKRVLPNASIGRLNHIIAENTVKLFDDTHGVRMDIFAENRRQMFTTEMQKEIAKFPVKRARYSGAAADVNSLKKGVSYEKLKDCYVIVISPKDPFGQNRMVYSAEMKFSSGEQLPSAGKKVIYVYCGGTEGREDYPDLVPFCRYVMGEHPDDAFVKKIDAKVRYYSRNRDWRMKHMEWEQYRMELSRRAEEKGEKRGIRKTLRKVVRIQYERLMNLGVDKEQALKYIQEDYPQFSDQALQKILNV